MDLDQNELDNNVINNNDAGQEEKIQIVREMCDNVLSVQRTLHEIIEGIKTVEP